MTATTVPGQFQTGREGGRHATTCAHCAESLAGVRVIQREVDGAPRSFCCLGCAFIAEQVALAHSRLGATDRRRIARRCDDGVAAQQPARIQIEVDGMVCAACALLIEARLRATPGVCQANVDFAARRATVVYDSNRIAPEALQRAVVGAGYRVLAAGQRDDGRREQRLEGLRALVAWLALMPVMMLAVLGYLARPGELGPEVAQWLRTAQAVLTVPAALFSALPLWRAAASQLRTGTIGMDVPVALALAAMLGASALSLLGGSGAVYFDSATMLVALMLSARWWQQRALAQATAHINAAAGPTVASVQRLLDHPRSSEFETVASDRLSVGDRVIVPAGALVPADARVVEGRSALSQAWLTGESVPLEVEPSARVPAGSLNLERPLVVEVVRCGERTSLSALRRLIVEAASQRPRRVEMADRVARRFVLAALGTSAATALGWALVEPSLALSSALAVLIVACPCALSLAAPLASAVAQAALARRGILIARPSALEELARVDAVVFDKTGTLTEAEPVVTGVLSLRDLDDPDCLRIAASLESRSSHPFARALRRTARQACLGLVSVGSVTEVAGAGVEASINGRRYRFGKPDYVLGLMGPDQPEYDLGMMLASQCAFAGAGRMLADQDGPVAMIQFGEQVRVDAGRVLGQLARQGAGLLLVSGDRREAVEALVSSLDTGAAIEIHPEHTPAGKQALLARMQSQGRRVAMIGDGIDDAPMLAQADASIALASGSGLAQVRADVICLRCSLADVGCVFELARRATRVTQASLGWALVCSAAMLPLAITGRVSPAIAAVGMAVSSALVLANSLRLGRRGRPAAAAPTVCQG
ncbi:MAG TPA: heavy metal translocating P-type ATPase [Burkholderiaceae bacterium]|nr:heavy metal translocating P-type ATPase [Burkholderiaceae bacterium]